MLRREGNCKIKSAGASECSKRLRCGWRSNKLPSHRPAAGLSRVRMSTASDNGHGTNVSCSARGCLPHRSRQPICPKVTLRVHGQLQAFDCCARALSLSVTRQGEIKTFSLATRSFCDRSQGDNWTRSITFFKMGESSASLLPVADILSGNGGKGNRLCNGCWCITTTASPAIVYK